MQALFYGTSPLNALLYPAGSDRSNVRMAYGQPPTPVYTTIWNRILALSLRVLLLDAQHEEGMLIVPLGARGTD